MSLSRTPLKRFFYAAGVLALLNAAPVFANDAHSPRHPSHSAERWPQATLNAQAVAEVPQDTVRITLASEVTDATQQAVSEALGAVLKRAMDDASAADDAVKVTSGNYRVWPMNDKEGRISNWRGRGELYLESTDFEAASRVAAKVSDDMAIASLSFFVSPRARAEHEETLLEAATASFLDRARLLAQALGYSDYRLRTVELGGSGARYESAPRGVQAQAAMYKAADSLPLEGDTETISVSIHGSIFLIGKNR